MGKSDLLKDSMKSGLDGIAVIHEEISAKEGSHTT